MTTNVADLTNLPLLLDLQEHASQGWVRGSRHPDQPLTIWNYSRRTQYERYWNPTTRSARGLIVDDEGRVIARPFSKFFNLEEHLQAGRLLPSDMPTAWEKVDGSLIIVVNDERYGLIVASRGSFTSPQAEWARELIQWDLTLLNPSWTYLFELVHPDNRIVVDYGDTAELVLLGARVTVNGYEPAFDPSELQRIASGIGVRAATCYGQVDPYEIKSRIPDDQEGFVLTWGPSHSVTRLKVKGEEYVRLHRIVTGLTKRGIWETLRAGDPIESLLCAVPEEFREWVQQTEKELAEAFRRVQYYVTAELTLALLDCGATFEQIHRLLEYSSLCRVDNIRVHNERELLTRKIDELILSDISMKKLQSLIHSANSIKLNSGEKKERHQERLREIDSHLRAGSREQVIQLLDELSQLETRSPSQDRLDELINEIGRAEIAEQVRHRGTYWNLSMAYLSGADITDEIWRLIRPELSRAFGGMQE